MDFGFSQEQELLRQTARSSSRRSAPPGSSGARWTSPPALTDAFWRPSSPSRAGSAYLSRGSTAAPGLGFVDLTVLLEEMGRAVMPGPFFSTVLLGGLAILEAGSGGAEEGVAHEDRRRRGQATLALPSRARAGTPPA